jgi:site-specific DNA recombinase
MKVSRWFDIALASPLVGVPSLADWLQLDPGQHKMPRQRRRQLAGSGLRFAFYGRMSTSEYQDLATSRAWQLDSATSVTAGHGAIVAEYFDTACSRRIPWDERPHASALLAAATAPGRPFDAVVIGEFERGFHSDQLPEIVATLAVHGVQVWMPETGGPVDLDSATHQALMLLLGYQSSREVLRARFRTMTAMRTQARDQGRHLGGRPPYGYRLVDAGAHPNAAHARWGRQLQRLDIDPVTAPHVRWIFMERLAGRSAAAIARELNDRHVPSPSAHDPGRNPHRPDRHWTLRTVAEILANPRYTGRQVWNRHRTDHRETVPGDKRTGTPLRNQLNPRDQWVVSRRQTHPALVSEQDFITVQAITATPRPDTTETRTYLLTGLLRCGICGRTLDAHWVYRKPGYRCRHGHTSTRHTPDRPKNIYVRQDTAIAFAANQLGNPGEAPEKTAATLRATNMIITCTPTGMTFDPPRLRRKRETF